MTGFSPSALPGQGGDMALLQTVLSDAAALGRDHMRELVDAARKVFFERMSDGKGDRKMLGLVLQSLNLNEELLLDAYPAVLLSTFTDSLVQSVAGVGQSDAPEGEPKRVSFRQLSLMDDDAVQERIDVLRMQQVIELKNQAALSELNALVCAVQGFATVRPDRNPLRPEMYVKALLTTLRRSKASTSERLQWMHHMTDTLCVQLGDIYQHTCARLISRGVEEAEFGRAQVMGQAAQRSASTMTDGAPPRSGAMGAASGGGYPLAGGAAAVMVMSSPGFNPALTTGSGVPMPAGSAAHAPMAGAAPLLTVERLHQLLGSEWPGNGAQAGAPNPAASDRRQQRAPIGFQDRRGRPVFAATVPAALDGLTDADDARHVLDRVAAHRQDKNALLAGGEPGKSPTAAAPLTGRDLGNLVGREVVQVMIAKLAADARLLAPVRSQICRLEAPLLELTQTDPRFFGDKSHPARRLLDTICQRGLAFRDENDPALGGFVDVLSQGIDALLEQAIDNGEPFARALPVLQEAWSELTQRANQKQQAAMKALLHAEERSLAAAAVWRDLERRSDVRGALPFILTFVRGPWVQVIAESRTRRGLSRTDITRYFDLTEDLCWSTRADLTRGQESRLVRMIPGLLSGLRSGLKLIDFPVESSGAFMSELMSVHQGLLRRGTSAARGAGAPSATTAGPTSETGRGPTAVFERGARGRLSEVVPASSEEATGGRVVRYDEAVPDAVEPEEKAFRTVHPAERSQSAAPPQAQHTPSAELWFTPGEAAASGFMDLADWADSLPPDAGEPPPVLPVGSVEELDDATSTLFAATELSSLQMDDSPAPFVSASRTVGAREPLPPVHRRSTGLTLDDLVPGTRLQWGSESAPTRGELTWISAQGTMYLFTTETGKTQSLPHRLLERMVEHGLMRRIEADDLVSGALDGVAQEALQNSIRLRES